MPSEIITTDDLREFRIELLAEFRKILKEHPGQSTKKWLKSYDVRKLLGISPGTLQNMRINGTIPFTRMGGILFYDYEDIRNVLESNMNTSRFRLDGKR